MSKQSSNPVRELRYVNNDAARGVEHMEMLGIRYFMAYTPEAIAQASQQPELRLVATSGPWQVFELNDLSIVKPLTVEPVVVQKRNGDIRERWLEIGTSYFQNSSEWNALPVADGPKSWQRVDAEVDLARQIGEEGGPGRQVDVVVPSAPIAQRDIDPVTISNVSKGNESISFSVDKIGTPVLVKVSYFPNWKVKGADKVYRAAPNMMVVVPTSENVTLTYKESLLDRSSYLLTLAGIVLVIFMIRRRLRYGVTMPPNLSGWENASTPNGDAPDNLKD
jgi:hypothetical protein